MKRVLRLCAFLLVTVLLCGALCGCDMLDEARANHARWTADDHILLGGAEYLPIPYSEYFVYMHTSDRMVYVTDPEVPVLLSPLWGTNVDISQDGVILDYWMNDRLYCRADKYESIVQRLEQGFTPGGYCYSYYDYGSGSFEDMAEKYYTLTPQQVEAVNTVYSTVTPRLVSYEDMPYYDYFVTLTAHSDDHLLHQESPLEINVAHDSYYMIEYSYEGGEYDEYGEYVETMLLYEVPAEYNEIFAAIMKPAVDAEEALYGSLGFDDDFFSDDYEDYTEEDLSVLGDLLGM